MAETIRVQVLFTKATKHGTFTDALYYSQAEYAALKEADKLAAQTARADAYVSAVDNAPAPVEPTKEDLEAEKAKLEQQIADLDSQIAAKGK